MGLAASQARLLTLTSRQHTVEHRAQYLQAQKLRLANDSDQVYQKYIEALDATQLQTRIYNSQGKANWVEGSLNNLMRYEANENTTGNTYFVQDINDGKLYVQNKIGAAYENSGGDLFRFMDFMGVKYTKDVHTEDYKNALAAVNYDLSQGWDKVPYNSNFKTEYISYKAAVANPEQSDIYKTANELTILTNYSSNTKSGNVYLPGYPAQLGTLKETINSLKGTPYYNDASVKKILDYCTNFSILNDTSSINKLSAYTPSYQISYIAYDKEVENASEDPQVIDDATRLRLLLNGGQYKVNDGALTDIYNADITNTLNNYVSEATPNIGDALKQIADNIKQAEFKKSQEAAQQKLDTFLAGYGTNQATVEVQLANHDTYLRDLATLNIQDSSTHTEYENKVLGKVYEATFNAITAAGGYKILDEKLTKSGSWVHNMVKNAQVVLATYNSDKDEIDNITASSNTGIREISNDKEIAEADSEYETSLQAINSKDTKYSTQLNQLEEEHSAIQIEMESLKTIAKDNIQNTFSLFT